MDITQVSKTISKVNQELYNTFETKPLSVSKCLCFVKPEFDQIACATNCHEKGFNNPDSPYYQKSVETIIKEWTDKADLSKHYGSLMDDYIGMRLNKEDDKLDTWKMDHGYEYDKRLNSICSGFEQFYKVLSASTDYQYVTREQSMYILSKQTGNAIKGRFDCLFYSPSLDKFMIVDWKTTEKIQSSSPFGKMLGPCYNMDDCKHNEYTIQTHFYKKALCETYKMSSYDKVDCFICQMLTAPLANGNMFKLYKQNFEFNSELLDNIIDFSFKKSEKENGK